MTTPETESKELLRRFQTELFGGGILDLIAERFSHEFVGHSGGPPGDIHERIIERSLTVLERDRDT